MRTIVVKRRGKISGLYLAAGIKKEIEKLGRPQSQQIYTQELLVRASSTALLIS